MPTPGLPAQTDTIRSVSYASISSTYVVVGSAFEHSMRKLRFINNTNSSVMFSDDGSHDKWFVPSSSDISYEYSTNSHLPEGVLVVPQGTQIYVKYLDAVSAGAIYLECTYAKGQ